MAKGIFLIMVATKGNYYHWLADLLPRLLLVQQCGLTDWHERYIILHQPASAYEQETLQLLGISEERVIRLNSFETLAVNDLILADYLHSRDGQPFPFWKKEVLDGFKQQVLGTGSGPPYRKIYLLRGRQRTRQLLGEERLVSTLRELGFEIVDPQKLRLVEQAQLLAGARVVVSLHGAALANCIFCQPGTQLIEIRSTHKPPEYYAAIAETYGFQFDTVSLEPSRRLEARHLANEQDLLLTDKALDLLVSKLQSTLAA